ncbi:MAG: hypothetical protein K6E27_06710 [Eubacterium sp.]|nr:hypothetical protein [Eubacterium sp.]
MKNMKNDARSSNTTSYKQSKDSSGSALIVVIIIITIIIILTFSLMLVAYTYYSSQSKNVASKRCAEAANTLSVALEKELTDEDAPYNSSIWKYVRFNLFQNETWPYYDMNNKLPASYHDAHNEAAAFRYFKMDYNRGDMTSGYRIDPEYGETLDGFPGEVELCMYWVPDENESLISSSEGSTVLKEQSDIEKKDAILYIEIMCSAGSQSYTVVNKYTLDKSTFKLDTSTKDVALKTALENIMNEADGSMAAQYNPYKYDINSMEKWVWKFDSRE